MIEHHLRPRRRARGAGAVMTSRLLALVLVACLVPGCGFDEIPASMIPQAESAFAQSLVAQLRNRQFEEVEARLGSELRAEASRASLEKLANLFPPTEPVGVTTVGSVTQVNNGEWAAQLTYQYEYPASWLLAAVTLRRAGDDLVVTGINVQPMTSSLQEINGFSVHRQGALGYAFLSLAVLVPLFILAVFVVCLRTPIPKRKWLWAIFVLLGFSPVSLNLTTGEVGFQLFGIMLLGASVTAQGPFAPWVIAFAAPFGAAVFLARRPGWVQAAARTATAGDAPPA